MEELYGYNILDFLDRAIKNPIIDIEGKVIEMCQCDDKNKRLQFQYDIQDIIYDILVRCSIQEG